MNAIERTVRVVNAQGLHARPADLLVRCASGFSSEIILTNGGQQGDCRSILSLLTLGATEGTELLVSAAGEDAAAAIGAVCALFEDGFGESGEIEG